MDLVIYTAATDLANGFVTSKTDLTAVTDLGTLVFGDSEPISLQFTTAAAGTAPAWLGDNTYTVNLSLGLRTSTGEGLLAATNDFTFSVDTYSGHLQLSSADLASWVNAQRAGRGYLSLAVSVTTPSNGTETYAETQILVTGALPAVGTPADTPVAYATYAAALAAQTAAEASATSAGNSATAATTAKNAAQAAQTAAETAESNAYQDRLLAQAAASTATTKASEAAASAGDADSDRIAAQQAKTDAEAAAAAAAASAASITGDEAAAAASAAAALASEQAAALSEAAALASEQAAALSESNASASESAAAASATTALNAIAQTFKGGVAGASVPATSTLAGDYYRITSAGTSQSITWAVGDAAIYNGTSGSWTQLTGYFNGHEAITLAATAPRALAPFLLFDGATSNRRAEMTPGTAGAVAGMPASYRATIDVPAANPSANAILFYSGPNGSTAAITDAHALVAYIPASSASLVIRQNGADGAADARIFTLANFRTTYTGRIPLAFVFASGDSTTAPLAYIAGLDTSASFALTYGTGGSGTAPNWMPTTLDTTKFVAGLNWPAGRLIPHAPILGALTAAEVLAWTQTGLLPNWCYAGTGSAVNKVINGDMETGSGPTGWSLYAWGVDATGAVNGTYSLKREGSGSGSAQVCVTGSNTIKSGVRYRLTFAHKRVGNSFGCTVWNMGNVGTPFVAIATYTPQETVGTSVVEFTATYSGILQFGGNIPVGTTIYMDDFSLLELGPIARHTLQPTLVGYDIGSNKLPLLLTAGVQAVTDKREFIIHGITNTNGNQQLLGASLFSDYTKYVIDDWCMQTAGTPTVSAGSVSGGTQYKASGALAASKNMITLVTRVPPSASFWVASNSTDVIYHTIRGHQVD